MENFPLIPGRAFMASHKPDSFPQATSKAPRRLPLCTRKFHERNVEASRQSTHLHTGSWRLWCELCNSSPRWAPHLSAQIFIQGHQQLDRIALRGPDPRLEIWQSPRWRVHVRVYSQYDPQVPSTQANKNGATPLRSYQTKLWSKVPAHSSIIHSRSPRSKICQAPPASNRLTPIKWPSHRFVAASRTGHAYLITCKTNNQHWSIPHQDPQLLCIESWRRDSFHARGMVMYASSDASYLS